MNKKLLIVLFAGFFLLGTASAFIIDRFVLNEWIALDSWTSGGDVFTVAKHNYYNPQTDEAYEEFVLVSNFNTEQTQTMKFRDDGTFYINDKAVCFSDGTSSDGDNCF